MNSVMGVSNLKTITKHLVTGAAAVLLMSPALINATTVNADEVSSAKSAITSNENNNSALLTKINALQDKVTNLNDQVYAKTHQVDAKQAEIEQVQKRIGELVGEIETTQTELANRKSVLRKQLIKLQDESADSATGNVYIDFILGSSDFTDLLSRSFALNKISDANQEAMDAVKESEQRLDSLKNEQTSKKSQLVTAKAKLVSEQKELASQKETAESSQKALEKELTENKDALIDLRDNLTEAQSKAAQAAAKAAADAKAKAQAKSVKLAATKKTQSSSTNKNSSQSSNSNSSTNTGNGSYHPNVAGNSYPYGQCTWYVKNVAPWAGNYWGNGGDWAGSAAAAGFTVNHTPAAGAIIVFTPGQSVGGQWTADASYGHVGYVQSTNGSSVTITQGGMGFSNPAGPNTQTISGASQYLYIHR